LKEINCPMQKNTTLSDQFHNQISKSLKEAKSTPLTYKYMTYIYDLYISL
jgi:hypothetical protein